MDLNKVHIYTVALPKPLSAAGECGGRKKMRRIHMSLIDIMELLVALVQL